MTKQVFDSSQHYSAVCTAIQERERERKREKEREKGER
jgi:hypothetical protein